MDPISAAIIAALVAGVAGGVSEVGKSVIVDAYNALKVALKESFGGESDLAGAVDKLEEKPESAGRRQVLQEEVEIAQAAKDPDLQKLAQALREALEETPEGKKAVAKYQINVSGGQVAVIGDDAHVEGGIHQ